MNMNPTNLNHWHVDIDADDIAWLTLDVAAASTNTLSVAVMAELATILDRFDAEAPRGLVIRSGKEAGFIAGADINSFDALTTLAAAEDLIARGWNLFNRLAAVPYPTLALVRGHCLGGGLELSLACRMLVAVDEPGTRLGLPEVMLGIVPGWGGMLRLPQRVGPQAALDMMLTGKTVDAKKACKLGLADECVPPRVMHAAARTLVLSPLPRHALPLLQRLLGGPAKAIVAAQAEKQVARRASRRNYPAPYAIIEIWAKHGGNALAARDSLRAIVESPTARNLVRVFHLQERLKSFGKEGSAAVKRVHVVGAGVMGGDIAAWCALRGMTVTLQDQDIARIAPALQRAAGLFAKRVRDRLARRAVWDRLIPDPAGQGAAHADVVIEAIYENLDAKRALLHSLEMRMKPDAVLASNTSSLRIEDLAVALSNPSRLVGIHFFNPVPQMPLVEVVGTAATEADLVQRACAFVRSIDKLPLPVKSAPGFLVNAVLAPYMLEAMRCVDEGIAPEIVDAAALEFGMPLGPIELIDTVGLDIAIAAGRQLGGGAAAPRCLEERVARNEMGKKSGRGFYRYENGRALKDNAGAPPAGLTQRLIAPLIERTRQLIAEGVVADGDLADAGVIFGTGFAPFTGGPIHYTSPKGQR